MLLSWAVPKGPTLDPDARRMAVRVEDHPLDFFDFEGVIPVGEYGGGDVIVWDWGTWRPTRRGDPLEAVAAGSLHFDLRGTKLAGHFVLIRRRVHGAREKWLLVHKHDTSAVAGWSAEDHPRSVKSGRTNDDVLAAPAAIWTANRVRGMAVGDFGNGSGQAITRTQVGPSGEERLMPRAWSDKRERQYEHIKDSALERGESEDVAEEIAARTVNKERARAGEARESSRSSTDDISSGRRGGLRSHQGSGGRTRDQLYNEARQQRHQGPIEDEQGRTRTSRRPLRRSNRHAGSPARLRGPMGGVRGLHDQRGIHH